MREVLDLAVDKRLERLLGVMGRAGLSLVDLQAQTSEQRYDEELEGL